MIWGVQSPSRAEKLESEPSRVTYKRHWARFTHVIIEGGFILFILALLSGQTQEMRTNERSDSNWRQSLCSNEFLIDFEWGDNGSSDLMLFLWLCWIERPAAAVFGHISNFFCAADPWAGWRVFCCENWLDSLCRYVDRPPFDVAAVKNGPSTYSLWTRATSGATGAVQSGCNQLRRPCHSGNTTQTHPEESQG